MSQSREKAVIDGKPVYTSVTALNRFIDCERSWYFRYVQGLPDPPGPAAMKGIEAHERIAHYLSTGDDVLSEMERQAIHLMPPPIYGILVERKVDGGLDLGGIPMKGGIDLVQELPDGPVLTDWKFKGFVQGISPSKLVSIETQEGRQLIAYAEWYRRNRPNYTPHATLRHVHIQFDGKQAPRQILTPPQTLASVKEKWDTLGDFYANRLRKAAAAKSPQDLEPNLGHCHKYRKPCVYLSICQEGQKARVPLFRGPKGETAVPSMLDQLNALNNAPPAAVQARGLIVDESTVPDEILRAQRAKEAAEKAKAEAPPPTNQEVTVAKLVVESTERLGITPAPSAVATLAAAPAVPPTEAKPKAKRGRPSKKELEARKAAEALPSEPSLDAQLEKLAEEVRAPVVEEVKAPTAERPVERPFQTVSSEYLEYAAKLKARQQAEAAEQAAREAAAREAAANAVRLYFGCSPVGVLTKDLSEYAGLIQARVLEELGEAGAGGVADVRLSKHPKLDFGKWRAQLALAAKAFPPEPGHYVVWPGDELIEAIANGITSIAGPGNVVRGGR